MRNTHKIVASAIAALALLVPTSAFAAESSVQGYSSSQAQLEGSSSQDPPSQGGGGGDESSSLPFTGLDLGLMAVGGLALAGMGFGMRRLTRRPDLA